MRINFYATFRPIVGGKTIEFPIADRMTVRQLIEAIIARYAPLRPQLLDEQENLYPHVHVMVDGRDAPYLESGLETTITPETTVSIFPAVGGGAVAEAFSAPS